jgi:sugar lactone lactonase YvrE
MRQPLIFLAVLAFALGCFQSNSTPLHYTWDAGWMKLPDGVNLGNTHGCVALDAQGRVYLNTDSSRSVMVFAPDGQFLHSMGEDMAGGLHGMDIVQADGAETIWVTHTGLHQVRQLDMAGETLRQWSWPESSKKYTSAKEYKPTSVAVLPDGRFFVADGYGKGWVHAYSAEGVWEFCFGGPGSEAGKFQTPHGITWDEEIQRLVVADRENRRLQVFHPDGTLDRVVATPLNRPCHVDAGPEGWLVAELEGRVSILDRDGAVLAHLGEQENPALRATNAVDRDKWHDGMFLSPHCAAWGKQGDLWVVDWNFRGRLNRLVRQTR